MSTITIPANSLIERLYNAQQKIMLELDRIDRELALKAKEVHEEYLTLRWWQRGYQDFSTYAKAYHWCNTYQADGPPFHRKVVRLDLKRIQSLINLCRIDSDREVSLTGDDADVIYTYLPDPAVKPDPYRLLPFLELKL